MASLVPFVSEVIDFHYCLENYGRGGTRVGKPAVELHMHPFYQLDLFPVGGIAVHVEGRSPVDTTPWLGVLIPPMTGHGYTSAGTAPQISLKFHLHPQYWLRFSESGAPVSFPAWYGEMIGALRGLPESDPELFAGTAAGVIGVCLSHWLRQRPVRAVAQQQAADPWTQRVRSVLELVAADPCRAWTVTALAEHCHVSPDHFCRRFCDLTGKSPRRFVLEVRIRAAATQLVYGNAPIKDAAAAAGYATVHSFTRAFSKVFGMSPGAYVRTVPRRA